MASDEMHLMFALSNGTFNTWRQGNAETARLLLDASANVNAKLTDGSTPLALAAWKGHAEVVKLVLARGANYRVRKLLIVDRLRLRRRKRSSCLWCTPGVLNTTGAELCTPW